MQAASDHDAILSYRTHCPPTILLRERPRPRRVGFEGMPLTSCPCEAYTILQPYNSRMSAFDSHSADVAASGGLHPLQLMELLLFFLLPGVRRLAGLACAKSLCRSCFCVAQPVEQWDRGLLGTPMEIPMHGTRREFASTIQDPHPLKVRGQSAEAARPLLHLLQSRSPSQS